MKKTIIAFVLAMTAISSAFATKNLHQLQQEFVDLRFGLFIHFGMGTYLNNDWADPDSSPALFNPTNLNCRQWVQGAQNAGMTFGCISVKHHNGFCMWDTATTDYCVMNSGIHRDVLKEFADALREKNMKLMFHFSILDLHEKILPRHIKPEHTDFIKAQLRELLTQYGPVTAIMIDGWDAPWARISYEDISFEEIYYFIKSIQPECLVMDLNGDKYPGDALFYSDLKTYEQGAGQQIDNEKAWLPSMACDHLQPTWFWKDSFPSLELTSAQSIVDENIIPKNKVGCTFILNTAPNTDGLLDDNVMQRLSEIGKIWKTDGNPTEIDIAPAPIIATNIAKHRHATGSWSNDCMIHDYANDDDFNSCWESNTAVSEPWLMIDLEKTSQFNAVVITDNRACTLAEYALEYHSKGEWHPIFAGDAPTTRQVKVHRFNPVSGDALRIRVTKATGPVSIAEVGIYNESR